MASVRQTSGDPAQALSGLAKIKGPPPVHLWDPPFCGEIDMRIAADGVWYYMDSPIGRKPLVDLFASILRKDEDGRTYLVTPVEKCAIRVDDAPLLAVHMTVEGTGRDQTISFETLTGDQVQAEAAHPLRFAEEPGTGGLKPYVLVRGRIEALVARAIFYDLVAAGCVENDWYGVWSGGRFWPMQRAAEIGIV